MNEAMEPIDSITASMPPEISRDLLGKIIDEVFDSAIENPSIIEDVYRVIARECSAAHALVAPSPADCDSAFSARYNSDPADPAVAQVLAIWREAWAAARPVPAVVNQQLTTAASDILAERQRQITAEGWTPDHDAEHDAGELAAAGAAYALHAADHLHPYSQGDGGNEAPDCWPWHDEIAGRGEGPVNTKPAWWKPGTPRRNLIKAGALILAEIERLDRAGASKALKAYQVGDNDIVAAYDPAGAIKVLVDFAGYGEDFDVYDVEPVSDKVLDATEVFDQDEGKIIPLEKTLRQEVAELTEPAYLHGWE